jgi:arylformamidase
VSDLPWTGLDADELDRQYDARGTVDDVGIYLEAYREASTPMYALPCVRDVAYGKGPDERLDLFPVPGRPHAPLFVFVHGGYWRALAKEDSVFMAQAFTERGIAVASLDYGLAPAVRLEEIVAQCRRGIAWLHRHGREHGVDAARMVVGGSSAGGHLAAMLLAPGWQAEHGLPPQVLRGGALVSGLFDLAPVQRTRPNTWLRMDEAQARALSPLHLLPPAGTRLCIAAAHADTTEFKRQSDQYADACRTHGCIVQSLTVPGRNHFDVIMEWMNPVAPLTRATWALFD